MVLAMRLLLSLIVGVCINQSINAEKHFEFKAPINHQWVRRSTPAPFSTNQPTNQPIDQSRAPADQLKTFTWILQPDPQSIDQLNHRLIGVSDPKSPMYGQFLDYELINQLRSPNQSTIQPVIDFLHQHGIDPSTDQPYDQSISQSFTQYGSTLRVTARIATIETMFQTELHVFTHQSTQPLNNQQNGHSTNQPINQPKVRKIIRAPGGVRMPDDVGASTIDLLHVYDIQPEFTHFHAQPPINQPISQPIDQPIDQPIKPTQQPAHNWKTYQTFVEPTCRSPSGTFLKTSPQFIKQQYGITNPSINQPNNQTVHLSILGGFSVEDGPVSGVEVFEVYDVRDIIKYGITNRFESPVITNDSAAINQRLFNLQNVGAMEATLDMSAIYAYSAQPEASTNQPVNQRTRLSLTAYFDEDQQSEYDAIQRMLRMPASDRPHVYSISYGYATDASPTNVRYRDLVDTGYQDLALAGVTVIVASGDDGATGFGNPTCAAPPPAGLGISATTSIVPSWPGSSPFVLSVGATDFLAGITTGAALTYFSTSVTVPTTCGRCSTGTGSYACQTSSLNEQAIQIAPNASNSNGFSAGITSGGGFSSYSTLPSWQRDQVNRYFNVCTTANRCSLPPTYSASMNRRGYPDVAAMGGSTHYLVYNDEIATVGGTSLSSPLWGAVIGELVEVSLFYTGRPLGFVNPLLYQMYEDTKNLPEAQRAFRDITVGDNVCPRGDGTVVTNANCYERCAGFYTAPGWDPVTGLGSPRVNVMIDYMHQFYQARASSSSSSSTGAATTSSGSVSSSSGRASSTASSSSTPSSTASATARSSSSSIASTTSQTSSSTISSTARSSSTSASSSINQPSSSSTASSTTQLSSSTISSSARSSSASVSSSINQPTSQPTSSTNPINPPTSTPTSAPSSTSTSSSITSSMTSTITSSSKQPSSTSSITSAITSSPDDVSIDTSLSSVEDSRPSSTGPLRSTGINKASSTEFSQLVFLVTILVVIVSM